MNSSEALMMCNIPPEVYDEIVLYARKNNIEKVILFGSRATGTNSEKSDIDIAVSGGDFENFYWDIQEKARTLLMFDIVDRDNETSEELIKEIERDGVIIYKKAANKGDDHMEHNPYIDLKDETAITYSDIKDNGNGEYITVYFETPTKDGFSSMQVDYPNGIPQNVIGYTESEVSSLMEHYHKIAALAFEFAKGVFCMKSSEMLWYDRPAANWDEALPSGNGRLGAMTFGVPLEEHIWLNEDSIWSGGERHRINPSARENLQKVRELLLDEKIAEAEEIVRDAFCGTPVNQRHYMLLGELVICDTKNSECQFEKRSLDLSEAVTVTEYTAGGVGYTREVIASHPAEAILINIKGDKPGSVSLKIYMNDGRDDYYDFNAPVDNCTISYYGGMGGEDSLTFASAIKVRTTGGSCRAYGSSLVCEGCDSVTIAVACRTSYRHENYKELCFEEAEKALAVSYEEQKQKHIADYQSFYKRNSLELCDNSEGASALPTDQRLERVKNGGKDNKLVEAYFNFGKYLMISGSRQGTLPLNLQGIWNDRPWPAWGCKFTININTEMNYWPAEIWGFSDLHQPLFDIIEKMRPSGRITAKEMYGCGGFVCHHNTDLWGDTAPQDLWMPGTQWPMGAAWLCLHLWEHYKFTLDKDFLAEKFDTLKEAAEFFVDFLIEDKKGRLVTCPSVSPENTYLTQSGTQGSVCAGPSMDSQILYELFTAVIKSGEILGRDKEFCDKISAMRDRLPKPEIGKYGQIMEWAEDYDEVEPGHRHISQLFALYPADIISTGKTPELASAARATLERRLSHGGGHTGWSRAWIINHWARLHDGEKVYENVEALLAKSTGINMFDMHPPFQIDGNFGGAAGIAEALIQSINGSLEILPALPEEWGSGSFEGLRARGGFAVSAKWENCSVTELKITSLCGESCKLIVDGAVKVISEGEEVPVSHSDGVAEFSTQNGREYSVVF